MSDMSRDFHPIIIIGAGPAGLCAAYELSKRGLSAKILEAGTKPGWSWANMPDRITVLSPWKRNVMNGTRWNIFNMHRQPPVAQYHDYLCDYARDNALDVSCECKVLSVTKGDGQFELETTQGTFRCAQLINATGYFFNPSLPQFPGADDSTPIIHVHDFKSADAVAVNDPEARNALVIGGRVSAGQTATELADHGQFKVDLCLRHPLAFSQDPWLQKLAFWIFYLVEDHWVKTKPQMLEDTNPPMEGGHTRQLVKAGIIGKRPGIKHINGREVTFTDDTTTSYDVIVACTGFNAVLEHLSPLYAAPVTHSTLELDGFESKTQQGLYFIGLDKLQSFRSRYLRGIREDAITLAQTIKQTLKEPQT